MVGSVVKAESINITSLADKQLAQKDALESRRIIPLHQA